MTTIKKLLGDDRNATYTATFMRNMGLFSGGQKVILVEAQPMEIGEGRNTTRLARGLESARRRNRREEQRR
jgi:hypothetical protein